MKCCYDNFPLWWRGEYCDEKCDEFSFDASELSCCEFEPFNSQLSSKLNPFSRHPPKELLLSVWVTSRLESFLLISVPTSLSKLILASFWLGVWQSSTTSSSLSPFFLLIGVLSKFLLLLLYEVLIAGAKVQFLRLLLFLHVLLFLCFCVFLFIFFLLFNIFFADLISSKFILI